MFNQGPTPRYSAINPSFFANNRSQLGQLLPPKAIAVLHANDLMPSNADAHHPFVQQSDFFYLTGIQQEESVLVLFPDATSPKERILLFINEATPEKLIWEGAKHTAATATACSGIAEVHPLSSFKQVLKQLMREATHLYLYSNEHYRADVVVEGRNERFIRYCQRTYPLHQYGRLCPLMEQLRMVKSPIEIEMIQKACKITHKGFLSLLKATKPGVMEYALEGDLSATYLKNGADGFAYTPIVASGPNSCILHYIENNQQCQAGDLLLVDSGAAYGHYCSDLTRTIPISGQFTPRQKKVYRAVLAVMEGAKKLLQVGTYLPDYEAAVGKLMEAELCKLGLLTTEEIKRQNPKQPAYKKYFMHGTSHHLGLDTHDLADLKRKLEVNMVLTVEPGIYIPAEGIGIRLENNVVIKEDGVMDLMKDIPLDPDEIEAYMQEG
ncbi:MAG: aminopeptidase P N-terminal domain-containing protein [Cytophagales bacterium]